MSLIGESLLHLLDIVSLSDRSNHFPGVGFGGLSRFSAAAPTAQRTSWSHMGLPLTTVLFLSMVIFLA